MQREWKVPCSYDEGEAARFAPDVRAAGTSARLWRSDVSARLVCSKAIQVLQVVIARSNTPTTNFIVKTHVAAKIGVLCGSKIIRALDQPRFDPFNNVLSVLDGDGVLRVGISQVENHFLDIFD